MDCVGLPCTEEDTGTGDPIAVQPVVSTSSAVDLPVTVGFHVSSGVLCGSTSLCVTASSRLHRRTTSLSSDAARLARNEKARTRYATMSSERKEALLKKRRVQRVTRETTVLLDNVPPLQPVHDRDLLVQRPAQIDRRVCVDGLLGLAGPASFLVASVSDSRACSSRSRVSSKRFDRVQNVGVVLWSLPDQESCVFCGAFIFFREPPGFCCSTGQISLAPTVLCPILWFLSTDTDSEVACEFRRKNRSYNHAFAFTSIGMTVDPDSSWARKGIYSLKVLGKVTHFFNPVDGSADVKGFLQLFFLDTTDDLDADVLRNRDLREDVMGLLVRALSDNPYSKFFKRLRSWDDLCNARIVVIRTGPTLDQRNCNVPTAEQVTGVWKDGDQSATISERDIRVYTEDGRTHKVNYYYSCYNPLQYPLLFPYGQPEWHAGIPKK